MAGVWIDEILRESGGGAGRKVFGTKGAHIVVRLDPECRDLGIATLNSLGLPFYCIPWRGLHYFGPTETPYDGDPDDVAVTRDEVTFLLAEANRLLPGLSLGPENIVMTWAGVRPLTYDEAVPFGNRSRVIHDLSREGVPDAFAMTAGPVMTHRSAGRELTDLVRRSLAPSRASSTPSFEPARREDLEHATGLSDLLFRRRGTAWSGPPSSGDLEAAGAELAEHMGWDDARTTREAAAFRTEWEHLFGPERPEAKQGAARRP
jgi:glycerol-3-phosphate dehydrogenase